MRFKKLLAPSLLLAFAVCPFSTDAKPKTNPKRPSDGKTAIACPTRNELKAGIRACPDTGCGDLDPLLNKRKNIETGNPASAEDKDFQYLVDLPKKVVGYDKIGAPRNKLADAGEGKMIRVVAFAIRAGRKGSDESCNCHLTDVKDTDNHIVLVNVDTLKLRAKATRAIPAKGKRKRVPARTAEENTLIRREKESQTAEFTPRVRLHHPKLVGADLQDLIEGHGGQLLVRVTGLQMYDSEHALGPHKLPRHSDWEIHPVFKLEFCETDRCTLGNNTGWKSLEDQ